MREQLEVTVESTTETLTERSDVRAVVNPNNEITVTYLLYELERRFEVSTRLQRVRLVVLVALPVPAPDQITLAWILEHIWPIRGALLDPQLAGVLDELEEAQSGAAIEYEIRRAAVLEQRRAVKDLKSEYEALEAAARRRRDAIVGLIEGEGLAEAVEADLGQRIATGIMTGGLSSALGMGTSDENEGKAAEREAAQQALAYLESQIESKGAALTTASTALREAVDRFTESAVEHRRATSQVCGCRSTSATTFSTTCMQSGLTPIPTTDSSSSTTTWSHSTPRIPPATRFSQGSPPRWVTSPGLTRMASTCWRPWPAAPPVPPRRRSGLHRAEPPHNAKRSAPG
ncbi:hypothetical protein [Amycolatopsis sp. NPDC003861]